MKILCSIFLVCCLALSAEAQELTQLVTARITDRLTGQPLQNASIRLVKDSEIFGGQADETGSYSVALPVGRYKATVSFTGYEPYQQELLVISGKQAFLNVSLVQTIQQLREIEVTGAALPPEVPGQRSLTIEKTLRFPANFFDPVRVATAYPGVVAANDQGNSIMVRGNSPNGLLWRLNGLDIVNPNHLANAGTLSDKPMANGGGVNILSAQMLDRTDFYTGAFPASYGNALSGIIDMKLREGNKNKFEYTAQASLIGMDVAAEGPLGKNKNTSFLANYRYSTVGLLSMLGINFGDEAITFQDFSLNLSSTLKNGGNLSVFGFYGNSKNDFDTKPETEWKEDKDRYDILYKSASYAAGLNYSTPLFHGKLSAGLAYSDSDQKRDATASPLAVSIFDPALIFDHYRLANGVFSSNLGFETAFSTKTKWQIGIMTNYLSNRLRSEKQLSCVECPQPELPGADIVGENEGLLFQPFTNFSIAFAPSFILNAGLRYLQYSYNNSSSMEPRIGLSIKPGDQSGIDLAYSLVSQLQLPQVYAATGNQDLGFTRSHHFDLGYNQVLTEGVNLKTGIFYQRMFDVPVEQNPASTFSTLNLLENTSPGNLVNQGTGENYGADVTIEKSFYRHYYFLFGGSYYESKYTGADGIKRDTRFNGNYTFTTVYGKEWTNAERHRTIGLNARVLYLGGLRQSSVNVPLSRAGVETAYDETDPYNDKLNDYFRVDVRLSFRKNRRKYTRTFALDIQNLTNQQNEAYRYYDFVQQKVVTKLQLGIIPVLVYRIDF